MSPFEGGRYENMGMDKDGIKNEYSKV